MDLLGLSARLERVVGAEDTAAALGSGDVPVLATPRLVAWAEAATTAALAGRLPAGSTSVGTRIELDHRAPTAVGGSVVIDVEVVAVDERLVRFTVQVTEGDAPVAAGVVVRAVVDRDRFLGRLRSPS